MGLFSAYNPPLADWRGRVVWLVGVLAGAGQAGWRAADFAAQAMDPALEGVLLLVSGRIDSLPQRGADGHQRFELAVDADERLGAASGDHHLGPGFGKTARQVGPRSRSAPGDQHASPGQFQIHRSLPHAQRGAREG